MAIEEPFDYPTMIGVNAEVGRLVRALKEAGQIEDGDDITVNLRANANISQSDTSRTGTVETIYRDDENGKGAIDSSKVSFTVELACDANN